VISGVPFSIRHALSGLTNIEGVLCLEGEDLVLGWEAMDALGILKSSPSEIRIPLRQVDALEYRSGFLRTTVRLQLRVRHLECLASLPGAKGAEVTLWCKRKYKVIARELANAVKFHLLQRVFTEDAGLAST
jgi:hypothetical protein